MAKSKGTSRRRSVRRRAAAPRQTAAVAPPPTRDPHFQALSVIVAARPGQDPARAVAELAKRAKLQSWRVEPVDEGQGEFELVPPARAVPTPGKAWDLVYRLRAQPEVVHAEPLFEYAVPDVHQPAPRRALRGEDDHPATANDFEWSLKKTKVLEAWTLFGNRPPGVGVTIGHPDTGYTPHPELADPSRLLADQGFDFDDNDPNPLDDLDDDFLDNPGHGTATGSVIVSNRGAALGSNAREFVSGVAPFASLIPIRATESVVLFSMRGLRQAIDHAVARGVQVISMSLGGPLPSPSLRNAIRRAVDAGTVVLAAAGNQVRVVVFPAAFEEVIAVAASTVTDGEWPDSCRGPAVDITAPGASVWRARVERAGDGSLSFSVKRGSGTSYAVATVAGIAALWVSLHGFAALVRRYGAPNVARVFKKLLQETCRTPRGWDTGNFGPGIANAHALLTAPLPDVAPARKLRDPLRPAVAADTTGLEAIVHLLPEVPRADIERGLADMLGVPDRELPRALQDVGDELAFQMVMTPSFRDDIERRARKAPRVAGRARAAAPTLDRSLSSARLAARLGAARR